MPFTIIDAEQRSAEWFAARCGRLTGSVAGDMLATIKTGEAAARRNLRIKLALERVTGRSLEPDFISKAMQDGIDREADARVEFELATGNPVFTTGFLCSDDRMTGASLDGHLGNFAELVSIKCRQHAGHWAFIESGRVPDDAMAQMVHECWITGATAHHYVEFNPDFPSGLRLKWTRIDGETLLRAVADYQAKAIAFLAEVDAQTQKILDLAGRAA